MMDIIGGARRIRGALGRRARTYAPRVGSSLPPRVRYWLQLVSGGPTGGGLYEIVYERHGEAAPAEESIGHGDYDLIGAIELQLLRMEGLRPTDTVVDLGCGTGRLAVHLVPALTGGRYIGIDIARSMLTRAEKLIRERAPAAGCQVVWVKQTKPSFELPDGSVDIMCAYSVFTHMEHEDTYNYLVDARRVVRPGGKFIVSCLPLDLPVAREWFVKQASLDLGRRWSNVRSVTTTVDMMEAVAEMAGWHVGRWYRGDEQNVEVPGRGRYGLGQSVCVLVRPA